MNCPNCSTEISNSAKRCTSCEFVFFVSTTSEEKMFFSVYKDLLQSSYIKAPTPWQQSGKSGGYEDWVRLRIPVSECIDQSGKFLDIGCANGFLIECLLDWTKQKKICIEPFGLDFAPETLLMAKKRLSQYKQNLFLGNTWNWVPPFKFDFVRTELDYVPINFRERYINQLMDRVVAPYGKLLIAQYRSQNEDLSKGWINKKIEAWGFNPEKYVSGYSGKGLELCRIAVLKNGLSP